MGPIAERLKEQMEEIVRDCISQLTKDYKKRVADSALITSRDSSPPIFTPKETSESSPSPIPQVGELPIQDLQGPIYPNHSAVELYSDHIWTEPLWTSHGGQEAAPITATEDVFDSLVLWPAEAVSTSEIQDWNIPAFTATRPGPVSNAYEYSASMPYDPPEFTGMMSDIPTTAPDENGDRIEIEYQCLGKGKGRAEN